MPHDPNWREKHAAVLRSADEAVRLVKTGDAVFGGGWTSVPASLCNALAAREDVRDITMVTFLTPVNWDRPGVLERFRVITAYTGPYERAAARASRFDYVPIAQWRAGGLPPGLDRDFDVMLVPISPPDAEGFCSFGPSLWFGQSVSARSKLLIGEVHPEFIRTYGDNRIHVSRFARLVEFTATATAPSIPPRSEETDLAAQIICTLVASEIVYDGATLQFGIGDVSAALPVFLGERRELGVHTELLPGGIVDLVAQGVVTGQHKALHPGKVVAAACAQLAAEELAAIDENPVFEFYDFTYTDDLRNLLQIENFIAVNNALAVDITGNAASESMGPLIYSGTGGQAAFAVGASTAAGGSVIVLPSSQLVNGERVPRIRAAHPEGTIVTVHRGFVDFVVTEQGIARLRGKTVRERMRELYSVSHPDLRGELKREVRRIYEMEI